MSFDLYIYASGYWSPDDAYLGGEAHPAGKHLAEGFGLATIRMLIVQYLGYEENLSKISWFPPETSAPKEDTDDAEIMEKVVHYRLGASAITLFAVREDDPYIGRRAVAGYLMKKKMVWLKKKMVCLKNDDRGDEAEIRENADYLGDVYESANNTDTDCDSDDNQRREIDDCKYKKFEIGQEYKTIDSFKRAVNKYAVKKRRDIRYKKSDRRHVTAICSDGKCPRRLYASINSSSTRVVIRSLQEEYNCTWQENVFLLTNARIADIYIEEFRLNPDFSANQLQEKLLAFFSEYSKCDAVKKNLGESFNAAIRIERTKPIVEMLEEIRRRVMISNEKKTRSRESQRAVSLLEQQIKLAKNCRSLPCGMGKYEVSYFSDRYIVHLRNETSCTCRMSVISGIPCCHIASALMLERNAEQDPKTLISDWFKVEKLRACYARSLQPVNGMNLWKVTTDVWVNPPPYKKHPGRPPRKKRKREKGESKAKPGKAPRIGIKMEGHNVTKCNNQPVYKPPKKPPGRPCIRPMSSDVGLDWLSLEGGPSSHPADNNSWRLWNESVGASSSSQPPERFSASQSPERGSASQRACGGSASQRARGGSSSQRARGGSSSQPAEGGSSSQPAEDLPSLSSALPRKKRGRPRKNLVEGSVPPEQPPEQQASRQPIYDTGPIQIPREGYSVFTSVQSGDDYVHLGKSVRDTSDNTILPSSLYRAR
ncbi:unnamed protein product [Thlaspi arvense]|uniref:SWIM-type domain-containing protein n=1 Tax=Thlaspi arvense TaxID=13288 RepID=A0AAU9RN84_THLAR|nr:unnamed protein product [Thlaspi arvense]